MEGRLNLGLFDEFSCVRIAYDKSLDDIREKYNRIVNNPEYMEGEITQENATPLNNEGKARLKELIYELERIST